MGVITIIILLAAVCNFLLGVMILAREKARTRLSLIFGAFCLAFSVWALTNFLLIVAPSAFMVKSTYATGALSLCVATFWALEISGKKITKTKFAILSFLGLFFTIASYFGFKIPELTPQELAKIYASGLETKNSAMFFAFYVAYLAGTLLYLVFTLTSGYLQNKDIRKKQIGYVLIGVSIDTAFILAADCILPIFGHYEYSTLLDSPSSLFLVFFSALAIGKYHLFELKVILTEILVVAMGVVLFLLPFIMRELQFVILTSVLFIFFCFIGYLLIKGSHREVKQKEILEQTVHERTKELETAKNLAEMTSQNLQKKNEELERFFKLTIGRELRMVDLKKKIRELEEKAPKNP